MVLLVIGIALTSIKGKNEASESTKNFGKAMPILLISTVGYVVYVVVAQIFGVDGMNALFFQSIGMAIGGLILSAKHETSVKSTLWNLIPGVVWGIGNLFMFYSQPKVGVATSFIFTTISYCIYTRHFPIRRDKTSDDWYLGWYRTYRYCSLCIRNIKA